MCFVTNNIRYLSDMLTNGFGRLFLLSTYILRPILYSVKAQWAFTRKGMYYETNDPKSYGPKINYQRGVFFQYYLYRAKKADVNQIITLRDRKNQLLQHRES